jgi:Cu(I)/Ag(I) efflux system membrane fusion protein
VFREVVDYIDPVINAKTRVAKARVVLDNDDLQLKPEMFVSGNVQTRLNGQSDQLTIPKSAVLWTGKRSLVYAKIQSDEGIYFRMREVVLGPLLGESYLVENGLSTGEEIAVNGTFSIDAAAQLAGKPSMMNPNAGKTTHDHEGEIRINKIEGTLDSKNGFSSQLTALFENYLPVKDALVASDASLASSEAASFLEALERVDMSLVSGEAHDIWMEDLRILRSAAESIRVADDLVEIREKLVPLSDQLYYTLKKFKIDVDGYRQFCPMAFDFEGAFWLSDSEEILNPYFGSEMLTCGNVEETL